MVLRGHEFHNSRLIEVRRTSPLGTNHLNGMDPLFDESCQTWCDAPPTQTAYYLTRGNGIGESRDGILYRNVLASYTHLHSGGVLAWAAGLVRQAQLHRESRQGVEP